MKHFLKFLYHLLPFKKHLFSVLRIFNLPSTIYQHLYFKGFFKVKVDANSLFMLYHPEQLEENQIFWKGLEEGWEKKSVALWKKLCKNAKTIMDVGANTGLYSLIAATLNKKADIYAFEPLPTVIEIFRKNIAKNNVDINAYQLALSNFKGEASVFLPIENDFAYSVTVNKSLLDKSTKTKELKIQTTTLKDFIHEKSLPSIDLMKLDVETHEPEVLEGMGEYLKKFAPTMLIEVLNDDCAESLNALLQDMDYLIFNIDDENNSVRQIQQIEKSDHWNLLLCNEQTARQLNLI